MKSGVKKVNFSKERLIGIFLLAFISHFILDGFLWFHFATNPINMRRILYNTLIRAAIAEWLVSYVAGVQSLDSFMIRGRSMALAVLIYGPPLVTILNYILDVDTFFWYIIKIPETLVPSTVSGLIIWIISALIYDFTRLILFIKIKAHLLASVNVP